jgi:soluble lytic murein transglycosylase-like protein
MILVRASHICLTAGLLLTAVSARADVMEINADGARWIAGPLAEQPALSEGEAASTAEIEGIVIPDQIVANTAAHAQGVPAEYVEKVHELAARFDLSPSLIEAVVWQESRWREGAVSHAGARGLAQLMPGTARELGVDPSDPFENLEGGARYLREQLDRFDGDLEKALAAYNAGPGRVERAGGIPNIRETQGYVAAIMGRLANHSRPDE